MGVGKVRERPIIFNSEMVRAILDGRKTMTRRPLEPQPSCAKVELYSTSHWMRVPRQHKKRRIWVPTSNSGKVGIFERPYYVCPHGDEGDRWWVRETFNTYRPFTGDIDYDLNNVIVNYYASDNEKYRDRVEWRPSIHMPRWASRITLEITNVKVERLQEITEEDTRAEGIINPLGCLALNIFPAYLYSLYAKKSEYQWNNNPWVWVIEFKKI